MQPRSKDAGLAQLQSSIHAGLSDAEGDVAPGARGAEEIRCVPLHVHGVEWLLPCADIVKIVVVGKIGPVPGAHSSVRGVIAVSGTLYTLIDLGRLVSGDPTRLTIKSRAVCLESRIPGANLAILVDRALDIQGYGGFMSLHPLSDSAAQDPATRILVDFTNQSGRRLQRTSAQKLFEVTAGICGVDNAIIFASL